MSLHSPPHPGEIVKRECLVPLGLTVNQAARGLGVTRRALSSLVNGSRGVSAEMAIRLSAAFGSTPEVWLQMQMSFDLWEARKRFASLRVERFPGALAPVTSAE